TRAAPATSRPAAARATLGFIAGAARRSGQQRVTRTAGQSLRWRSAPPAANRAAPSHRCHRIGRSDRPIRSNRQFARNGAETGLPPSEELAQIVESVPNGTRLAPGSVCSVHAPEALTTALPMGRVVSPIGPRNTLIVWPRCCEAVPLTRQLFLAIT